MTTSLFPFGTVGYFLGGSNLSVETMFSLLLSISLNIFILFYKFPFLSMIFMSLFFRVADHSDENQMTPSNLAIVFGPTLLRPEYVEVFYFFCFIEYVSLHKLHAEGIFARCFYLANMKIRANLFINHS